MRIRAKKSATDGRLEQPLLWALAALGAGLAPHVIHFPAWISVFALVCGTWRWLIESRRWHLPPTPVRLALALFAFLGVLAMYRSINGIVPGTALLAVMAALKLLESRRRRDLYVILFIALFLLLASLLRQQTLWSLPWLVATLGMIACAWLNIARQAAPLGIGPTARFTVRVLLHALPLMLAFWILFPRVPGPFWAIPTDKSAGARTGLSDTLSPGDISRLVQSDAVAFRVRFDTPVPEASALYWRGLTMSRFNGRSWQSSRPETGYTMGSDRNIVPRGDPTRYSVTIEPTDQHWVFALEMPTAWVASGVHMGPDQQLVRRQPLDKRMVYEVESHTAYQLNAVLSSAGRTAMTGLAQGTNPRSTELARRMRGAAGSDRQFVAEVLRMFRTKEFYYTLEPPALGRDPVDEFLFSTRRGFCEHYASAFAVLARAAGIPTRIVAGYHGGEMNPIGNYMIVRQSDAHAWTEVWLPDEGWVRIDPTAAVSELRIESGLTAALREVGESRSLLFFDSALFRNMGLTWDALHARWDEWVLGYGPETQQSFMRWLGMEDPRWETMLGILSAITVTILIVTMLMLAGHYRGPRQDPALREFHRLVKNLKLPIEPYDSPMNTLKKASLKYPGLAGLLAETVDRYLACRYAGRGSITQLSDSVDQVIRLARRAPATTAAPR